MNPAEVDRRGHPERPARPRRRRLSHRAEVGDGRQEPGAAQVRRLQRRRGRPRRLHGPQRAGERPAPGPRGHGDRRLRRRGRPGLHLRPRRVPAGHPAARDRRSTRRGGWGCWAARSSSRRSTSGSTSGSAPARSSAARRRRCIASIEGRRGSPRPRPPYPADAGLWGNPTLINNVETFANVPPIIRNGRRLVRLDRHREEQGDQGLRPGRQDPQHRAGRGADGHHAARDRLGDRRRRARRRQDQGGADRRPLRRLHPGRGTRHAGRLRVARAARLDHGLRRHDRHGRDHQHGRRRQVLHGVLHGRVVRQVHPLPRGHRAAAPPADQDHRAAGDAPTTWPSSRRSATW